MSYSSCPPAVLLLPAASESDILWLQLSGRYTSRTKWFDPTWVRMIGFTPGTHCLMYSTLVTVLPALSASDRPNSVMMRYLPVNSSGTVSFSRRR